ncbi:signal peptidase I, partial [Paenarthrobacter nicotinovorans]
MIGIINTARGVLFAILIALCLPFLWQFATGGSTLTVTGTSMHPTYERGDVLFVDKVTTPPQDFWQKGNIVVVVFDPTQPEENRYVHRVDQVLDGGKAILKGDGNPEQDVSPVALNQVYGTPTLAIQGPWAHIYQFTQSLLGRIIIFGTGIITLIILDHHARRTR